MSTKNDRNTNQKQSNREVKNHKKKEDSIEYHFSYNKSIKNNGNLPYFNTEIPIEKIRKVFDHFRMKFGENEIIKEYSTFKHNDLELTVFPDGSSFCRQIESRKLQDQKINEELDDSKLDIFVTYKEKHKISNDFFPCKYIYYSALDIIDVIFNVNKDIKIVLSTIYENNRNLEKIKSIEKIGRPNMIKHSSNTWCEMYMVVDCASDVDDVHNTIEFIKECLL